MPILFSKDVDITQANRYHGEAVATANEAANVGGDRTLQVDNYLFQSDADAQNMADDLLTRLKERKSYYEISTEFCPVPLEPGDTIGAEEYISANYSLNHSGLIRQIRLRVGPQNQTVSMILED
jgi:hypothetical protein